MKRLNLTISAIAFFSCFLFVFNAAYSQEVKDTETLNRELGYAGLPNEPMSGYWMLVNSKTEVANLVKHTEWTVESGLLTANTNWEDAHKIEETISASFKWDNPPDKMLPGSEVQIKGTFVNNEYSSISRVPYGLLVSLGSTNIKYYNAKSEASEVLQISKNYKQHNSEVKDGWFTAPKHYAGESTWIQLMIDCYVGQDHYVTTYIFSWTESTPL
jgi:hypothetical protein